MRVEGLTVRASVLSVVFFGHKLPGLLQALGWCPVMRLLTSSCAKAWNQLPPLSRALQSSEGSLSVERLSGVGSRSGEVGQTHCSL